MNLKEETNSLPRKRNVDLNTNLVPNTACPDIQELGAAYLMPWSANN